ncbi:uncharacterized protein LOC121707249 [Alosa sapidissima]|uniref:uncharacterized protein LOC121707249 n=1 Tax=Alosa sapidissima TaxID=34773 RepID=UPI001C0829BF|nr:uncharacterized protein LOC121707249 [Alosa sapidissima]XP_041945607.1 uncharacterized protein LOC121707249 [Alosa sapidissima]
MSILDGKVCLAEAFGKNTGTMTVTTGSRPTYVDVSDAVLARTTKAYYFAAFETDITECSLQSQTAIKENTSQPPVTSAEKQTESPPVNCDDNNTNQTVVAPAPDPKMNFMSVLVTGLRIVFAKAVAINVIMTVKVLVM